MPNITSGDDINLAERKRRFSAGILLLVVLIFLIDAGERTFTMLSRSPTFTAVGNWADTRRIFLFHGIYPT